MNESMATLGVLSIAPLSTVLVSYSVHPSLHVIFFLMTPPGGKLHLYFTDGETEVRYA